VLYGVNDILTRRRDRLRPPAKAQFCSAHLGRRGAIGRPCDGRSWALADSVFDRHLPGLDRRQNFACGLQMLLVAVLLYNAAANRIQERDRRVDVLIAGQLFVAGRSCEPAG